MVSTSPPPKPYPVAFPVVQSSQPILYLIRVCFEAGSQTRDPTGFQPVSGPQAGATVDVPLCIMRCSLLPSLPATVSAIFTEPFGNDQTLVTKYFRVATDLGLCACSLPTPLRGPESSREPLMQRCLISHWEPVDQLELKTDSSKKSLGFPPRRAGVQRRPIGPSDRLSIPVR